MSVSLRSRNLSQQDVDHDVMHRVGRSSGLWGQRTSRSIPVLTSISASISICSSLPVSRSISISISILRAISVGLHIYISVSICICTHIRIHIPVSIHRCDICIYIYTCTHIDFRDTQSGPAGKAGFTRYLQNEGR